MLTIARHQLLESLRDAKFLFLATLILIAFILNGFIYSERYHSQGLAWREAENLTNDMLEARKDNLQQFVNFPQQMVKPPNALAFIADGGDANLPDTWTVNAFIYRNPEKTLRGNKMMPVLCPLDWSFIVGVLMTLLAVLLGFRAVCGEKRDGTLRLILSFPMSRIKLFIGKYLGMLAVLLVALFVGATVNMVILVCNSVLSLSQFVLISLGWAVLLSILCLSAVLLLSMAVSSMTARPAVSLVVLLVCWVIMVVAVPGLARLIAEQTIPIRSKFEVERDVAAAIENVDKNISDEATSWYGDPFHEHVRLRAEWIRNRVAARQKVEDEANMERIRQADFVSTLSSASPSGLLSYSLQEICGTGVRGFKEQMRYARLYQQTLLDFTTERDANDPDSPHLVFSSGTISLPGVFSTKPVEMSAAPRSSTVWPEGGILGAQEWPLWQTIILIIINLHVALIAFIALLRYDPR